MRVSNVSVRNFRCLKEVDVEIADYTVLVGPNGSGKSSLMHALTWFAEGGVLRDSDMNSDQAQQALPIKVTVTFTDLDESDSAALGQYVHDEVLTITRTWTVGSTAPLTAKALQGPGFAELRQLSKAGDFKPQYQRVRSVIADLQRETSTATVIDSYTNLQAARQALLDWEQEPGNRTLLCPADLAIDGEALSSRFAVIFVPASADLVAEVGDASKGSLLSQLFGAATEDRLNQIVGEWEHSHADEIAKLEEEISTATNAMVAAHEQGVNKFLNRLVPEAELKLVSSQPGSPIATRANLTKISATVETNGYQASLDREGHGTQRAVMISAIQSIAENARAQPPPETPLRSRRCLLVAFEEPEVYQHPVRARHFSQVLQDLGAQHGNQVLLATHSPYFVPPGLFGSIRRFSRTGCAASVSQASAAQIAVAAGLASEHKVRDCFERDIPSSFSESFFAEMVVLVEGDTDRVTIEAVAGLAGDSLLGLGVAVTSVGGKGSLKIPFFTLEALGIPVYVVADGDFLAAGKKQYKEGLTTEEVSSRRKSAKESHRNATEDLLTWFPDAQPLDGKKAENFGDPTSVTTRWALFHDDLETELAKWKGFEENLELAGSSLRNKKKALAYRTAAMRSDISQVPKSLLSIVNGIESYARQG